MVVFGGETVILVLDVNVFVEVPTPKCGHLKITHITFHMVSFRSAVEKISFQLRGT